MKLGYNRLPLSQFCDLFTDGDWVETKDQSTSGIRLIQTGNVGVGEFKNRKEKARYISAETSNRLKCQAVYPGDCLVSRLPDPVGRTCIVPETGEKMITAVDCTIIRFNRAKYLPAFFKYFSQSREYLSQVEAYCTGATRKRISRKNLAKVAVPVVPLLEQQRIVSILDEAFAGIETAIANTEKNLANSRGLFESFAKHSFESGESNWPKRSLAKISMNLDSKRVPITKSKRIPGKIPYYGASGVVDHVADFIFDEDLLLVSEDGANLLARTYPIAFSISGKSWVNNHAHILKFSDIQSQRFIEYYLNSISLVPYVSGMAQPKLNQRSLNSIPVPFPDFPIRAEVVEKLDFLNSQREQLEIVYQQKLVALQELEQSLIQKAFSGELTADKLETEVKQAAA